MYRSPNSQAENNEKMLKLIEETSGYGKVMFIGDFNLPNIKWSDYSAVDKLSQEFISI